jgi:large subunit ribosomal protein L13e
MVKHNNVIPNGHFHKKWQERVKTWFDQPTKKKERRLRRAAKAARLAPRPTQLLRPAVRCPTIKVHACAQSTNDSVLH